MADMNKLLQFPSPFLKSSLCFPFPIPLQLSSHHAFSPLHRPPLSLSSIIPHFSSPSNSPNFLLISTSLESDGSLVFKFGDASEVPPAEIPHSSELQNDDLETNDFSQVEEIAEKTVVDDSVKDQQNPLNLAEDSIVEDNTSLSGSDVGLLDSEAALEDQQIEEEMIQLDLPLVQFEAEPILDDEVNYAGLPSIAGQDDSPSGNITDAAFPSLEESVFNDAVPSAILQCDDIPESKDISEPAGPEAHLNGVQTSTVALSVPSAMTSLPQATKVNDAITPSIQLSDADLHSEIAVAADPGSGISAAAAAEINRIVENSAPSLCVVSAAASVAHPAEALAGGDDAYFVCDNWFGVADGVGQWSFGGIDKGLYAQELIQNCERLARKSVDTGLNCLKELLQESAAKTESSGAARVLVAHIVDQVLHVANIGDSGFIIVRNGTVFKKSSPMFHEFNFPYAVSFGENPVESIEEYHVELEDGDIIVTATDGLFDNLYEREIASLVFKAVEDGKNVKDIAELLAFRSQEVGRSPHARTPFADAAQAAGHTEFRGGKFDHVTVIVSNVQKE